MKYLMPTCILVGVIGIGLRIVRWTGKIEVYVRGGQLEL